VTEIFWYARVFWYPPLCAQKLKSFRTRLLSLFLCSILFLTNNFATLPFPVQVSGSDDKVVRVYSTATGGCLQRLEGHTGRISAVALSVDGTTVVTGSDDETVRMWSTATGECVQSLNGPTVSSVALSRNGSILVAASFDRTVRVFGRFGQILHLLEGHTGSVSSVAVSASGDIVVSGSWVGVCGPLDRFFFNCCGGCGCNFYLPRPAFLHHYNALCTYEK
jgi:WD40 repeat protein